MATEYFGYDDKAIGQYWNELIENGVCSEETLNVVTSINGYTIDTLDDVLYAVTGYRSWEQYTGEDEDNDDEDIDEDELALDDEGDEGKEEEYLNADYNEDFEVRKDLNYIEESCNGLIF